MCKTLKCRSMLIVIFFYREKDEFVTEKIPTKGNLAVKDFQNASLCDLWEEITYYLITIKLTILCVIIYLNLHV